MAETLSNMLPLGTVAPDFSLPDTVSGLLVPLSEIATSDTTVIMFICNHCPYVIHVMDEVMRIVADYQSRGVNFVAISSNDVENYPADSPERMKAFAADEGFTFPYLYDESQGVAKAYDAACTPDFYVFGRDLKLTYRGRMDAATPGNRKANDGKDLREAIDATLAGKPAATNQYPSMGCNIKWK